MTREEMTQRLSEKMGVRPEDAETALEVCGWDLLDAALWLERQRGDGAERPGESEPEPGSGEEAPRRSPRAKGRNALRGIGAALGKLLALGNRNRFEVRRRNQEETALDMPVTVLILLLLAAFWPCVVLLAIGLLAGFQYRFSGRELGRPVINRAMDKASQAADKVLEEIRREE